MVRTFTIIVLIVVQTISLKSQSGFTGIEKLYNKAEYLDGKDKIFELLYQNIQFPTEIITEPVVTVMVGVIEISPKGEITRIFSLNDCDPPFISEFRRRVSRIDNKWKSNGTDTTYFIVPIEFRNVPEELYQTEYLNKPDFINDPIVCMLDMPAYGFLNDTVYLRSYEESLFQHKYYRSMMDLNLLINRQPFNVDLYIKKIRLLTYSGNSESARIEEIKARLLFNQLDKSRTTIDEE